ncbi:MAG: TIR domain-containing protein [Bacteroidales bacterium]|nr:TIR domain-containing protein [Bacteroidales bacterium]
MSYRNKTYVAFDGDNDMKYYRLMTAWKEHDNIDFDFLNAHDLNSARDTSTEESIKSQLRIRMANSKQMLLLVGENTKYLRKFLPWEIELARKKDIPIIMVNLNNKKSYDDNLCPSTIKDWTYTISIPFKMKIIQYALDNFPDNYYKFKNLPEYKDHRFTYIDSVYEKLGL